MNFTVDEIAPLLLEYYQTQNKGGNDQVFLLTTIGSYTSLFGVDNLSQVIDLMQKVWRETARSYKYGHPPADSEALLIASYQCYLAFQESSDDKVERSEDSLGVFIAAQLGEKAYDHSLQRNFFNPSDETVESRKSFQYVVWRTVQNLFAISEPALRLNIPDTAKYRGRWLQYPKKQVFINHSDIHKLGRILSSDYRFLEDPSGESVREVLFEKWKNSKSYFNRTFREWVEKQSKSGRIELLYCTLIAKYIREKSYSLDSESVESQSQVKKDRERYRTTCVEIVAGSVKFYEYDAVNDYFYKKDKIKISIELGSTGPLIFARSKGIKYNMYRQIRKVGPKEGSYFITVEKRQIPTEFLGKVVSLIPYNSQYVGLRFENLVELLRVFPKIKSIRESEYTYLTTEGGLKKFHQNHEYYETAGPHLPEQEFPVRKMGYGKVNYDPDSVTAGSYRAVNGSFTIVPFQQNLAHEKPIGFSLSRWSYAEGVAANIVGYTVQNPVPELTTRKWIEQTLLSSTAATSIEVE